MAEENPTETAQSAPNEPFDDTHDKPITQSDAPTEGAPVEAAAPAPEVSEAAQAEPVVPPTTQPQQSVFAPTPASNAIRELLAKAQAAIQNRKAKKLEKILEFLNVKGKITNDEVEKLLHVSDATATRYLSALEKQSKIKQVGKTGTGVEYIKP